MNFTSPPADKDKIKMDLGFNDKKIILSVGRLHRLKDPMILMRAFEQISVNISNSLLVIVGSGILQKDLINFSTKTNIPTLFMGNVYGNELLSLYQSADVFVLTSLGDSLSTVLLEAMACRCPCIANNSGSNPEILGMKDLLIEPGNQQALTERIEHVLDNPSYAEQVSNYLCNRARQLFSMEVMTENYYQLYGTVSRESIA